MRGPALQLDSDSCPPKLPTTASWKAKSRALVDRQRPLSPLSTASQRVPYCSQPGNSEHSEVTAASECPPDSSEMLPQLENLS